MASDKQTTILNSRQQAFSTKTNDGHWAKLRFLVDRNMVYLEAETGNPADRNRNRNFGRVRCPMAIADFEFFLLQWQKAIDADKEMSIQMQISDTVWKDGQRTKDPEPVCMLIVGKNDKLVPYIEVRDLTNVDLGTMRFFACTPDRRNFNVVTATGEAIPQAKLIAAYSAVWLNVWKRLVPMVLMSTYQPPAPPGSGGNYSHRNNSGGNGGGGRSAPAASDEELGLDEDIPF